MNKKIHVAIWLVVLILTSSVAWLNKDIVYIGKEGGDEILKFDYSSPGKWQISLKESSVDGEVVLSEKTNEVCWSSKMIEEAKNKSLKEKLGFNSLDCSTVATRESKGKAKFTISCTGTQDGVSAMGVNVLGIIESHKDFGLIFSIYKISSGDNQIEYKREFVAKRVGECSSKL